MFFYYQTYCWLHQKTTKDKKTDSLALMMADGEANMSSCWQL